MELFSALTSISYEAINFIASLSSLKLHTPHSTEVSTGEPGVFTFGPLLEGGEVMQRPDMVKEFESASEVRGEYTVHCPLPQVCRADLEIAATALDGLESRGSVSPKSYTSPPTTRWWLAPSKVSSRTQWSAPSAATSPSASSPSCTSRCRCLAPWTASWRWWWWWAPGPPPYISSPNRH